MGTGGNPEGDIATVLALDRPAGRKRGMRRWLIPAVAAAAALGGIVLATTMNGADAYQYRTQEATRGDLKVIVTATGTLQPTNKAEVGSELSGIIERVNVDYNDKVAVGQVLAQLDTSKLHAQVMQAQAALKSSKAKVLQAQATVRETQGKLEQMKHAWVLSGHKVPSQSDLDAAEAAFLRAKADETSANAAVDQAQGTLGAMETDMSKAVIRSQIDGIVLTRSVEPGQTVAASFQAPVLFTLAEDLTKMELLVNVDEADIGKIREGQSAEFTVAAYPNRTFQTLITQVRYGSSTTSGVVTYETVLQVDNSDLVLRPGMTATANITVKKVENAILIPSAALRFIPPAQEESMEATGLVGSLLPHPPRPSTPPASNGNSTTRQQTVWRLKGKALTAVPVTIGSSDGIRTEVVAGEIEPGTALVTDAVSREQ